MSNYTDIFGGGGVPLGAIVQGQFAADANYLPCDGSDQLKANYPLLDTTGLSTIGSNSVVLKAVPTAGQNAVCAAGNTLVMVTAGTAFAQVSTDGGNTWVQKSLAANAGSFVSLAYGNGAIVLAYNNATQVQVSTDGGNTWALKTLGSGGSGNWQRVKFAGSVFFVFVDPGAGTINNAATSADGITYTLRSWGGGNGFIDVAYNPNTGMYAFVVQQIAGAPVQAFYFSLDGGVTLTGTTPYRQPSTALYSTWTGIACDGATWVVTTGLGTFKTTDFVNFRMVNLPQVYASNGPTICGTVRYLNGLWWFTPGSGYSAVFCSPDLVKFYRYGGFPSGGILYADYLPSLGRYVFGRADSVASIAVLDIDTAKFRTPIMLKSTDGDRYFIRAK